MNRTGNDRFGILSVPAAFVVAGSVAAAGSAAAVEAVPGVAVKMSAASE